MFLNKDFEGLIATERLIEATANQNISSQHYQYSFEGNKPKLLLIYNQEQTLQTYVHITSQSSPKLMGRHCTTQDSNKQTRKTLDYGQLVLTY